MDRKSVIATLVILLSTGSLALAADGAAVYKDQCAKCHGADGKSDTSVGKALKIPALAGDASVAAMSEADLVTRIKTVAKHPSTTKGLSDDDLNAVATFIKGLAGGK